MNAAPEDGTANVAVVALLAKALGLGKGDVRVIQGASSRQKLVLIAGDETALIGRLEALLNAGGTPR